MWKGMKERCSINYQRKPNHWACLGCTFCKEWEIFDIFAQWVIDNSYIIHQYSYPPIRYLRLLKLVLDKDILKKGNLHYSPATCCIIPECMNMLVKKRKRENGLPKGVSQSYRYSYCSNRYEVRYYARISYFGKPKAMYDYDTPIQAWWVYKETMEAYIQEVAEMYKDQLPKHIYEALMNYRIEIDD